MCDAGMDEMRRWAKEEKEKKKKSPLTQKDGKAPAKLKIFILFFSASYTIIRRYGAKVQRMDQLIEKCW